MTRPRLTRRGERLVAWAVALLILLAPGFAEALGTYVTGTPSTTDLTTGVTP